MEDLQPTSFKLNSHHIQLLSSYHSNNKSEALRNALDELVKLKRIRASREIVKDYLQYVNLFAIFLILLILIWRIL